MSGELFLFASTTLALAILTLALFLTGIRLVKGPTLPDRVLALDMLTTIAIGYIGVIALRTGFMLYLDVAISISLVGFLATAAFARYILTQGPAGREEQDSPPDASDKERQP